MQLQCLNCSRTVSIDSRVDGDGVALLECGCGGPMRPPLPEDGTDVDDLHAALLRGFLLEASAALEDVREDLGPEWTDAAGTVLPWELGSTEVPEGDYTLW